MAGKVQAQPVDRFWRKVDKTESCWLWTGYIKPNGYANFYVSGGSNAPKPYVHRWAYEQFVGPIPNGLEIDHLCNVRHCVNPEHLEAVTHRVNLDRRNATTYATCKRGHAFDDENTYWHAGARHCRECRRAAHLRQRSAAR